MTDPSDWLSSWDRVGSIAALSIASFLLIVVLTRLSGKRTTGQMNNFDWIFTVAVGSLVASGILLRDISLLDAMVAVVTLGLCQYGLTWLLVRSDLATRLVKATPTLLTHKGDYLYDAMKRTRVTKAEINSALRREGLLENDAANWVVLETDGTFSIIPTQPSRLENAAAMEGVETPPDFHTN